MASFDEILKSQIETKYHTETDLCYKREPGFFLPPHQVGQFLLFKDELVRKGEPPFEKLPLATFDSRPIYFVRCAELSSYVGAYLNELQNDLRENGSLLTARMGQNMYLSRVYSEIEGTLGVENVPTTRKRLKEIVERKEEPKSKNDRIIKNMADGIQFISEKPRFDKENLFKLYQILSDGCLKEDLELRKGEYYRYDDVEVEQYKGCPVAKIEGCMESLFAFVEKNLDGPMRQELPHICHYYLLYVHPYFDYNGRTARMVSLWIYLLANSEAPFPPFFSEAINQKKNRYYEALEQSRDAHNDITYFLIYIYKTSIEYYLCYRNIEHISSMAKDGGEVLTDTELNYIKRILISNKGRFTYQDFLKMCQIDISKQGALKILNRFVALKILRPIEAKSKAKLFEIDERYAPFAVRF